MKHFSRLQARDYAGSPATPAFVFNLSSRKYFDVARKRGQMAGVRVLRGFEEFTAEGENDLDAALILEYRLLWIAAWNSLSAWSGTAKPYTRATRNAFGGGLPALAYGRHKINTPAALLSGFSFLPNQPVALRVLLFNPPKPATDAEADETDAIGADPAFTRAHARWRAYIGGGPMRWQFTITDGRFELARLSDNWTQAKQDTLDALDDLEHPSQAQQEQLNALRGPIRREAGGTYSPDAIFESVDHLSLGSPVELSTGKFYEILFLPEPRGRFNVILSGSEVQHVEVPAVLATGEPGIITGAGPLRITTNGGAFLLQVGRPRFVPIAWWLAGPFRMGPWFNSLGQFTLNAQADSATNDIDKTLLGTGVAVESEGLDAVYFRFKVKLSTTDSRFTPFLYSVQTSFPALPRPSAGAVVWDSSAHKDLAGNPPILDIEWSCDGANRQSQAQIRLRDVKGASFATLPGVGTPGLENRVASLSYGPSLAAQVPLITGGLVRSAQLSNMASALDTDDRSQVTRAKSQLLVALCDGWALLDESRMREPLIGDGMRLGKYIKLLLQNAGESEAALAGVSESCGRILPRAALGQGPCIVPQAGQSRTEWIRQVLDRWGMGATLIMDEGGVWRLGVRSLQLRSQTLHWVADLPGGGTEEVTQVVPFSFSSSAARNNSLTYPGRMAILAPLDYSRDFEEFFNHFRVEGAIDPETGQRFCAEWTLQESLSNPSARNYLGRLKEYETVRDEGLRSKAQVLWVLRSLVERYGRPGRFAQFETRFLPFLFPDDRVLVDGAPWRIKRINGGSMRRDRMTLVVQELAA